MFARRWRAVIAFCHAWFMPAYLVIGAVVLLMLWVFGGALRTGPWAGSIIWVIAVVMLPLFLNILYWRIFIPWRWLVQMSWARRRDLLWIACVTCFLFVWIGGGLLITHLMTPLQGLAIGAIGLIVVSSVYDSRVTLVANLNRWRERQGR